MTENFDHSLPDNLADEVGQYIDEGCPGDLNAYLDKRGTPHPQFRYHEVSPDEDFNPEFVPCPDGYRSTWVRLKDGRMWSTCVAI
jgi:hypothetical protein